MVGEQHGLAAAGMVGSASRTLIAIIGTLIAIIGTLIAIIGTLVAIIGTLIAIISSMASLRQVWLVRPVATAQCSAGSWALYCRRVPWCVLCGSCHVSMLHVGPGTRCAGYGRKLRSRIFMASQRFWRSGLFIASPL